ncbi:uncharacterized protein LOC108100152 [Drosophila ficusphila]|uniref:uncharacterized protein LOC108100152 n=1 Tax=Drosophila ficusphila TaxID=30025 RepID=UPI0007E65A2B|nr:uncharacterized protein LOC108100152 [Drosophila ficusphila]
MSIRIARQNMFIINTPEEEEKCTEAQLDILLKINTGEYRLVKKNKRSSVWNVYREIERSIDGSKLRWRYFCTGCKRVMQSTGGTTSNLRIHKCHVRYLKQNAHLTESSLPQGHAPASKSASQALHRIQKPSIKRPSTYATKYDQFYQVTPHNQYSDLDEDTEVPLEEECLVEHISEAERVVQSSNSRPLLKLFSEENLSVEPEPEEGGEETGELEEQVPIELDLNDIHQTSPDYNHETVEAKSEGNCNQFDASALAEAESYAKSWAHAFLRLSEDQKFYAKRSIDELLVLGRLERLNISTVTSLSSNL